MASFFSFWMECQLLKKCPLLLFLSVKGTCLPSRDSHPCLSEVSLQSSCFIALYCSQQNRTGAYHPIRKRCSRRERRDSWGGPQEGGRLRNRGPVSLVHLTSNRQACLGAPVRWVGALKAWGPFVMFLPGSEALLCCCFMPHPPYNTRLKALVQHQPPTASYQEPQGILFSSPLSRDLWLRASCGGSFSL